MMPMPASSAIDCRTYYGTACPANGVAGTGSTAAPYSPIGATIGLPAFAHRYWNLAPTYGPQLLMHTDLCNPKDPEFVAVSPDANLPRCMAPFTYCPSPAVPPPDCHPCVWEDATAPCPSKPPAPAVPQESPTPVPVTLPGQLSNSEAFWRPYDKSAYVIGGITNLGGTETDQIVKFHRGMPVGPPYGPPTGVPFAPNAPGGEITTPAALPAPRANQALSYDVSKDKAYLMGGSAGGALSNEITVFDPVLDTSTTLPKTLFQPDQPTKSRNFDFMSGAWARSYAYAFGGRYIESDDSMTYFALRTSNHVFRYEPSTDTLTVNPIDMPPSQTPGADAKTGERYGQTAVTVGTNIFLFGGMWQDVVTGQTRSEVAPSVTGYNPLCGTLPLPCPVPDCDMLKFDTMTGQFVNLFPNFKPLCGSLSGIYDGTFIFVFGFNPATGAQEAWRFYPVPNPVTLAYSKPVKVAEVPAGAGDSTTPDPTDYSRGGYVGVSAVSTGCSAYLFGGIVDSIPVTSPPDGPLSDKITWFGKCEPQIALQPAFDFSCANYPIWFDIRGSVPGEADIRDVSWDFGDATVLPMGNWYLGPMNWFFQHPPDWFTQYGLVSHTYVAPGNYAVKVTLRDFDGITSTLTQNIPVTKDSVCAAFAGNPSAPRPVSWPFATSYVSLDSDEDGIPDVSDNCPAVANHDQVDSDGDGMGDACTLMSAGTTPIGNRTTVATFVSDGDRDGVVDRLDNCPAIANHDQADMDSDRIGDVCDNDIDGDGIPNRGPPAAYLDNCPWYPNPDQADANHDGVGDDCAYTDSAVRAGSGHPVASGVADHPSSTSWTAATAMALLAGLVIVGALVLLLRRPLRPT